MDNVLKPTIIIPAYNERDVIERTLLPIYPGIDSGEFSIVLAVNGTSDDTVAFVKQSFPNVICLDIKKGCKTNAINEAERCDVGFPRLYMDADVVVTLDGVRAMIKALEKSKAPLLVAPKAKMDVSHASFWVKVFYEAWFKTKFYTEQGFGGGIYGLNQAAREKFNLFPKVIADDGFIREVVNPNQQSVIESCISTVSAPSNLLNLIKIKSRSKLGNLELKKKGFVKNSPTQGKRFSTKPSFLEFITYGVVNLIASKLALRNLSKIKSYTWQKDISSRKAK